MKKNLLILSFILSPLVGKAQAEAAFTVPDLPKSMEAAFTASDMQGSMREGDKAAILMVHFGTTHDDTRLLTIEALNQKAKEQFENQEIREAYTSRIVIRRLKEKGLEKLTPMEALQKLKDDGFTHVTVQPTNIIEGVEMGVLRSEVSDMTDSFKDIRIGNPLLYTPKDYQDVIKALHPAGSRPSPDDRATVWVGHGSYSPATAQYAMLDYMLKAEGYDNCHVITVEGYPSLDEALAKIEKSGLKKVSLRPFLFVAGEHAKNDIGVEIKEALEDKGYQVELFMEGLGQNERIQAIFIDHIRFCFYYKMNNIKEKKND